MRHLRVLPYLVVVCAIFIWVIAACGSDEPTPEPTATEPPIPTFTATAVSEPTEAATPAPAETPTSPPAEVSAAAPVSPVAAGAAISEVASSGTLSATASGDCAVPLSLDLSGYPDVKSLPTVLGCPQAEASLDPVAINEFGGGPDYDRFMLWFGSEKQIYVLFANQTWLAYSDTWSEGEPEIMCNPTNSEKTSPPLPRRGFGKLWCTVSNLQQEMGTIDREERLCQHSVTQRFDSGTLLACFEDATIRYFRLLKDGRWDMMMVQ